MTPNNRFTPSQLNSKHGGKKNSSNISIKMTEITQPYWSVRRTYSWGREWLFSGNRGWKRTALSSLYQLETRKIPVCEEAIQPSEERHRQWRSCVRKNSSVFSRGWTNNRKDVKFQCVGVQQLVERGRKICVGEECVFSFPFRSQLWVECAWRHGLTVLPPHSQNN